MKIFGPPAEMSSIHNIKAEVLDQLFSHAKIKACASIMWRESQNSCDLFNEGLICPEVRTF